MNKFEAFKKWVSWIDNISDVEILRRLGKEKKLFFSIKKQAPEYLDHIKRLDKYRLFQLILQEKMDSKRGPGKRRQS